MAEHARLEGAKEATRQLEAAEKVERDRRQVQHLSFKLKILHELKGCIIAKTLVGHAGGGTIHCYNKHV